MSTTKLFMALVALSVADSSHFDEDPDADSLILDFDFSITNTMYIDDVDHLLTRFGNAVIAFSSSSAFFRGTFHLRDNYVYYWK